MITTNELIEALHWEAAAMLHASGRKYMVESGCEHHAHAHFAKFPELDYFTGDMIDPVR